MAGEAGAIEMTVAHAAAGDEVAFAVLVAQHHPAMARVAYVVCGDSDTAADAVQAAWAIAWQRLATLRDRSQVRAWLVAIAANEARQAVRRRRRHPVLDISPAVVRLEGDDRDATLEVLDLRRVLRTLKPDERALLAMRYAADLESADIARQLGMSASGVRSRLARLLDRLRVDLAIDTETDR